MKGRPPKPKAQHKKQGTYRKDRHDPAPADVIKKLPTARTWLSKRAKEKWRQAGTILVKSRLLTELDLDALASYCEAWSSWREAIDAVEKYGQFVDTEHGPKKHPAQQIAEASHRTMLALQERLGLLPLARQRLRVDTSGSDEKSKLEEFVDS